MIRRSVCPTCSKVTTSTEESILKAKCNHCGGYLHKPRKIIIFVPCLDINCAYENKMPAFGWKESSCQSCSKPIYHPASKPVGAHLKGKGLKNDARITIKLPSAEKKIIESIAKKHDSTSSAVLRQMIRYFDNKLC